MRVYRHNSHGFHTNRRSGASCGPIYLAFLVFHYWACMRGIAMCIYVMFLTFEWFVCPARSISPVSHKGAYLYWRLNEDKYFHTKASEKPVSKDRKVSVDPINIILSSYAGVGECHAPKTTIPPCPYRRTIYSPVSSEVVVVRVSLPPCRSVIRTSYLLENRPTVRNSQIICVVYNSFL